MKTLYTYVILLFLAIHFTCFFQVGAQRLRGSNSTSTSEAIQYNVVSRRNPLQKQEDTGPIMEERRLLPEYNHVCTRTAFYPTSKPWTAIGKVQTPTRSCTGILVGPSLMLTSQCCVDDAITHNSQMSFTPAYYDGNAPFGSAYSTWYWWDNRYSGCSTEMNNQAAFNYVVVKLDRRIGDSAGYWCFKAFDRSWGGEQWNAKNYWHRIGYAGDISNAQRPFYVEAAHPMWFCCSDCGCKEYENNQGAVSYLMTTTLFSEEYDNDSGDPIYGTINGELCVVGLMTMSYRHGIVAGGPGLEALIQAHKYD